MRSNAPKRTTWMAKQGEVPRQWWVVDANGVILGRLATLIADTLRGKNKPQYTPHEDAGDFVIVINAEKIALTGKKWDKKMYRYYTGQIGGLREATAKHVRATDPTRLIEEAVSGMLPKNKLRDRFMTKLKIYAGPDHPHAAQEPQPLQVGEHAKAA